MRLLRSPDFSYKSKFTKGIIRVLRQALAALRRAGLAVLVGGFASCGGWVGDCAYAQETHNAEAVQPNGKPANAPMKREHRVKNWSSGGSGCCVCASGKANCNHVGKPEWGQAIHDRSLQEPGGHYPEKLERVFEDVKKKFPDFKWTQWYNEGEEGLRKLIEWNDLGFPVGVTWGTGERYGMRPIAHMVSLIHIDPDQAGYWGIVDNNYPEETSWVPWIEGKRRWNMGGMPWGVVILPPQENWPVNPNKPQPTPPDPFNPLAPLGPDGLDLEVLVPSLVCIGLIIYAIGGGIVAIVIAKSIAVASLRKV